MAKVGQREIKTQEQIIQLFKEDLGYRYLGDWKEREGNSNIETEILTEWLKECGHDEVVISKVLRELDQASSVTGSQKLYDANKRMYGLLRYGVRVTPDIGENNITVNLVDWKNPEANDFAIAEEVTVHGRNTKRPDLVLYVNGIALGVIELKRSKVFVSEGIRQNLDNQKPEFIEQFFTTNQIVMAGNNTQGLRYGVIQTPEKYFLEWKKRVKSPEEQQYQPLESGIRSICNKERFLELIHDFIVFDGGIKKICRHNQYYGVKASQERVRKREGGIIWHTQGSGKSLTMVWLAKWIRENIKNSRVLIITDRVELDEQIDTVFAGVDEEIFRARSGDDLVNRLNESVEWLMCSLIHKFGSASGGDELTDQDIDQYIKDIQNHLPHDFEVKGDLYIFIDECHRTQSGKMHAAMNAIVPNAMLIGFTGTPLLKADKGRSIEIFGPYIDTYKFDEAIEDGVVLDLKYEARDIEQTLNSPEKVDQWFEANTQGLSDVACASLKKRWGTMQSVLSSQGRLEKIKADILFEFAIRDRLMSGTGNAMLVAGSIYEACKYYELFQSTPLADQCAVVTSYEPNVRDITGEETGEGETEALHQYGIYRKMLARYFDTDEDSAMSQVDKFEREVRKQFIKEPSRMKLLIVVDKLLTGFDAPPATVLFIDKSMKDHNLFQAICRVNRLDGASKDYGYIIDYKDLFGSLSQAVADYTGDAFDKFDEKDVAGLLKNRLEKGKEQLEEVREAIKALCEPVSQPRHINDYMKYFISADNADDKTREEDNRKRIMLYRLASKYTRAYSELANQMQKAGYSIEEAKRIKEEVTHFENLRQEMQIASGDSVDLKSYEPAMRHLIDTYIGAEEVKKLTDFENMSLVELLIQNGEGVVDFLPKGIQKNKRSVAETIENNVRKVIVDEMASNPKYFANMSDLLDALIEQRNKETIEYRTYLEKIQELAKQIKQPSGTTSYPPSLSNGPQRVFYDNLEDQEENIAILIDEQIRSVKQDGWRGNKWKEKEVRLAIAEVLKLKHDDALVEHFFQITVNQSEY